MQKNLPNSSKHIICLSCKLFKPEQVKLMGTEINFDIILKLGKKVILVAKMFTANLKNFGKS